MLRTFSGRLAFCALALAFCSISGLAGTTTGASKSESASNTLPMGFDLLTEGPTDACGTSCRQLLSASGMVTADTPRQFLAFVRDNSLQGARAPNVTVVLESDGGSVLGALELGRAIRRLGFATMVGHVAERRSKPSPRYGEVLPQADCQSMCGFVLLGGVQRQVPLDARVLVHQIWLGDRRDDAVAANYTAEDLVVVQRDIGSIIQYTLEMGGDMELVALSLKVPPWEPMRALTREELRRTRLDATEPQAQAASPIKTVAGPAGGGGDDDVARAPINGRGWLTVSRSGHPALARTHPLTFEGERIGDFDLYFTCSAAPDSFALTYRETRFGPADHGPPRAISQIGIVIDGQAQPLKIASSEKKVRRGELESIASAVLPARLVRVLASDGPAAITVETDSTGNPRTSIRVGNSGFGRAFRDLDRGCGQPRGRDKEAQAAPAAPAKAAQAASTAQ
jgi:hypothetical protein